MNSIAQGFFLKKDYEKAIYYYDKAGNDGFEGLGDCYSAKGDKQKAAYHYRKFLNLNRTDGKKRVEQKLKELGY